MVPLASRRIGSRPNAIVDADGGLWVRQYMNWTGVEPGTREFYLFQPLTAAGVNKSSFRLYSYTENGDLNAVADCRCDCNGDCASLGEIHRALRGVSCIRTDSYWKIPTNLDRRYIDLKFRSEHGDKIGDNLAVKTGGESCEPLTSKEFIELQVLTAILKRTRATMHRK